MTTTPVPAFLTHNTKMPMIDRSTNSASVFQSVRFETRQVTIWYQIILIHETDWLIE